MCLCIHVMERAVPTSPAPHLIPPLPPTLRNSGNLASLSLPRTSEVGELLPKPFTTSCGEGLPPQPQSLLVLELKCSLLGTGQPIRSKAGRRTELGSCWLQCQLIKLPPRPRMAPRALRRVTQRILGSLQSVPGPQARGKVVPVGSTWQLPPLGALPAAWGAMQELLKTNFRWKNRWEKTRWEEGSEEGEAYPTATPPTRGLVRKAVRPRGAGCHMVSWPENQRQIQRERTRGHLGPVRTAPRAARHPRPGRGRWGPAHRGPGGGKETCPGFWLQGLLDFSYETTTEKACKVFFPWWAAVSFLGFWEIGAAPSLEGVDDSDDCLRWEDTSIWSAPASSFGRWGGRGPERWSEFSNLTQ